MLGHTTWLISDGYLPEMSSGSLMSHEAVCVLNVGTEDAKLRLTLFFEDREPVLFSGLTCQARRTNHIHLDKVRSSDGFVVPRGVPYAIEVESSVPVIVQHSRMDTTQKELSLLTTMAFPG